MVKTLNNRDIFAANLRSLMDAHKHSQGDVHRLTGIAQSTIGRVLNMQVDATIGTLQAVADLYKLQSWQLLVGGLDPSNPPVLREVSEVERELYERIKLAAQALAKYEVE